MAEYEVKCDLLFDPITMSTLQSLANSHFNRVSGICEKGESVQPYLLAIFTD